jgi:hypothetical protein
MIICNTCKNLLLVTELRARELLFIMMLQPYLRTYSLAKAGTYSTNVGATWLWLYSSMKTFSSMLEVTRKGAKGV